MKFLKLAILVGAMTVLTAKADSTPLDATWKNQDVKFRYSGFTTRYSCQGLHDKVRLLLLALGARRNDLKIDETTCGSDSSRPSSVVSLDVSLATLQPATKDSARTFSARWQEIDLGRAAGFDRGDCELIGQIRQSLLPLFVTRNVVTSDIGCTPHDSPTGLPGLKLDVWVAVEDNQNR